ncbi:MAG: hypothetical protein NG712_05825, partial [Omnitrophica bacterium]|nr:hypothetical protein [Candidatus Omnitrophota bacterium]
MQNERTKQILEEISLGPLTENATSELVKSVFSGLSLPLEIQKKISSTSWGFPSNIEEILRSFLENKIVYPKEGRWNLDNGRLNMVPVSLKEILDRRILELDDESREVLSKAAILGKNFNVKILSSLYGKNEGELLDILDKLKNKGLLEATALSGDGTLSFANNVIKENLYSAIEKQKLQQLHRQVANFLSKYDRSKIGRVYGNLRHHLKEAGEIDKLKSISDKLDLPPYIKQVVGEEEEADIEEIAETPLCERSAALIPDFVFSLRASWINSQLYPTDNKTRVESVEHLEECVTKILENDPMLSISFSGEKIIINARQVSRKAVNEMILHGVISLFSNYEVDSITFKRGLRKRELESFFSIASQKDDDITAAGGFGKLLRENAIANIKVHEVRYRKSSDLTIKSKRAGELFKQIISTSSAVGNIFSVDNEGLTVNREMLSDSDKAIDSVLEAMRDISEEHLNEDNKSFMMLETLYAALNEFSEKDAAKWEGGKKRIAENFLSLDRITRTKMIRESSRQGGNVADFMSDILSSLNKKDIIKILNEGQDKSEIRPDEFKEFAKAIVGSQQSKNLSYKEIQDLFKRAGVDKEPAKKALDDIFVTSFFNEMAEGLIGGKTTEPLDKKSIDNLKPLTEALIVKEDIVTVDKLAKSILARLDSALSPVRISAIEGIEKVSDVLINKQEFNISNTIECKLAAHLKTENDINVYINILKNLEITVNKLIHKRNHSLLLISLTAIKEEISASSQRSAEFKDAAEAAIKRILTPENINHILFSFRGKVEKDYIDIIDLMVEFEEIILNPLMDLLFKKDDARLDPFDIYMKKRNIALMMKKIGEKAISRLKDSLNDKRAFVVKNIIEVIGNMDDKKYLPLIEQAIRHPDKEVKTEA